MKVLYGNELLHEFKQLLDSAKSRLWVCSPYVGNLTFINKLSNNKFIDTSIEKKFITDINELSVNNFSTFQEVILYGELRTLSGVHAKIYIIDNQCLVSSANLTETAFERRHEIGVFLNEMESNETIEIFIKFWEKSEMISFLEPPILENKILESDEHSGFFLPKLWGNDKNNRPKERKYWLKPIGVTEVPITVGLKLNNEYDELHFSVKPQGIQVGDFLIAYGIGAKRILTLYEVTTNWQKFENVEEKWQERWSYFLTGKNLTPEFGDNWMINNLYASDLLRDYLRRNPNRFVTANRGKTLGALNYKKDKIGLTPEFAEFVLQRMGYL